MTSRPTPLTSELTSDSDLLEAAVKYRRGPAVEDVEATDACTADLLVGWYGGGLRFCPKLRSWHAWDGRRWIRGALGEATRLTIKTARRLHIEAAKEPDVKRQKQTSRWAVRWQSNERIKATLALASAHRDIEVEPGHFDTDPYLLNCQNGVLDLRSGELRPHDPADLITRLAPVEYDPEARAPRFEKFLRRIFADDADMIDFVRRAAGYALTGDTSEQCLFIAHGGGANGKSTLLSILQSVLGDYATTTPSETLLAKPFGDGPSNDIARLAGARLVCASETADGRRLNESRIKELSGGDKISARFLYGEYFEFRPQFKLWLSTNHRPEIRGADLAIWRRVHLLPFGVTVPPEEQDAHLGEALAEEAAGVLAWCVRGCLDWQARRLDPPEAVTAATASYRSDSDQLGRWLDEKAVVGEGFEQRSAALYGAYKTWCTEGGETTVTATAFGRSLSGRGFEKRRISAGWMYRGLGLRAEQGD